VALFAAQIWIAIAIDSGIKGTADKVKNQWDSLDDAGRLNIQDTVSTQLLLKYTSLDFLMN